MSAEPLLHLVHGRGTDDKRPRLRETAMSFSALLRHNHSHREAGLQFDIRAWLIIDANEATRKGRWNGDDTASQTRGNGGSAVGSLPAKRLKLGLPPFD